jgi:phthalate 4,5-dioxygenase
MLKPEDNERITRVGPGTPAGNLFRRYWLPALLSAEIADRDGVPQRVRILGEDLIAFRVSDGRVGLVDAFCPHRRAPLFFGRNEECGLRCVYHGWKFDVTGACTDLPSEPAGSPMNASIRLNAYPTVEKAGVVWTYMGPPEYKPPPPDYEWMRAPETHRHISKTYESCNYLQALEGGLDTAHSSFVHNNALGDASRLRTRDRAPRLDVHPTDYGYSYVSTRKIADDQLYVRVYQYIMPSQQMRGGLMRGSGGTRSAVPTIDGHIWVPIDDTHTFTWNWMCAYDESVPLTEEYVTKQEKFAGRGEGDFIPGTYQLLRNLSNDFMIDRAIQKTQTYTGIKGLNTQDFALQEGMGPVVDRSKEHLGSSDKAIVVVRRLMLEATEAVAQGRTPNGTDPAKYRDVRPHDGFVAAHGDWRQAFDGQSIGKW